VKGSKVDDWLISTDSPEIARFGKHIMRPPELAQDETPMHLAIQHATVVFEATHGIKVDAVMTLQPTSPLRITEDIDGALSAFNISGAGSLYTGYYMGIKHKNMVYDKYNNEPHFQRNGAIFITKRELLYDGRIWDGGVVEFEMPKSRSIDIDDMEDLLIAESILKFREDA